MEARKIQTRSRSVCLPPTTKLIVRNKICSIPDCGNSLMSYPNKLFFCAPKIAYTRHRWLQYAGLNPAINFNMTRNIFFCEDHFDMTKTIIDRKLNRVKWAKFKDTNYTVDSINGCQNIHMDEVLNMEDGAETNIRRTRSLTDNLSDITIVNIKTEMDIKVERDNEDYEQHETEIYDYGLDIKEERILTPDSAVENCNPSRSSNSNVNLEYDVPEYNYYLPITQECDVPVEFNTYNDDGGYNYYSNNFNSNGTGSNFTIDMVQIESIASESATWAEGSVSNDSESTISINDNMFQGIMTITLNIFDNNFVCCSNIEKARSNKTGKRQKKRKIGSENFGTVNLKDRSYIKLLFKDKKVHPANSRVWLSNIQNNLDRNKCYCVFCKRLFTCYDSLIEHFVDEHLKSLTCNLCNKNFVEKYNLLLHLKFIHRKVRFGSHKCKPPKCKRRRGKCPTVYLFQCLTCEGTFKILGSIKDHVKDTCSGLSKVNYIRCDRCDLFFTKRGIKYHERWHKKNKHLIRANIEIIQFSKSKCDLSDIKKELRLKRENTMNKPDPKLFSLPQVRLKKI